MINLLLIIGLILLIFAIVSFSFISTWSVLLAIVVIILILRDITHEERISKIEKKLEGLIKLKSPPDSVNAVIQTIKKDEVNKTIPSSPVEHEVIKEKIKPDTEYVFENELNKPVSKIQQQPSQPSMDVVSFIKSKILSGNPIAKIGILILFIGVAFLLNYVATHVRLPIEYRLSGVFLTGIIMVVAGWRMSPRRKDFSNILQGGGVGLMYLTVYAAFAMYDLLPYTIAFVILTLIVIATGLISVLRDAKAIAVTGILGGFLAPVLITIGPYHHVVMFSYYLALNIAILGISWFKSWRDLNLIGFIFTFILSALWGWQSYQSEYLFSTEIFLILFFLFYIALSILFTIHQGKDYSRVIDSVITFGTPIVVLGLQTGLMRDINHGLAWSTLILTLFYAGVAFILYLIKKELFGSLSAAFAAIAAMFGTITIPLSFSGLWTSADWALESILLLWFGVKQKHLLLRLFGGVILLSSTLLFIVNSQNEYPNQPFFNEYYLSGLFIVFSNLICSYLFTRSHEEMVESESTFAVVFLITGFLGWYILNIRHIFDYVSTDLQFISIIFLTANTSLLTWVFSEYLDWSWLYYPAVALLPAMFVLSIPVYPLNYYHPDFILLFWFYSFTVLYLILYRHERYPKDYLPGLHLCAFLFLTWFIANQIDVILRQHVELPFTWSFIVWGGIPAMMLYILCYGRRLLSWPLTRYEVSYCHAGSSILVIFILLWFMVSNLLPGNVWPLLYIPLFNPLDITIAVALIAVILWARSANEWLYNTMESVSIKQLLEVISVVFFIWLTAILLRTLHQWMLIPYDLTSLWNSMLVQNSLSIFWTILALLETYIAARSGQRILWFLGFLLIWVVIFKLFLIDLSATNTLERIITFICVGIILLINGYISPLPPKENK